MVEPDLIVGNSPWPGFAAQFVAEDKGFYKEAGVNIKEKHEPVSTDLSADLQLDKVDLAWISVSELLAISDSQSDFKAIAASDYADSGVDGIVARGVSRPEDLIGKDIVWGALPLQSALLSAYLRGSDVKQEQLRLRAVPPVKVRAAFLSQTAEVAIAYDPWLSEMATDGEVVFSAKDAEGAEAIATVLVGKADVISAHREDIVAYLKALEKGTQFYEDNRKEALEITANKLNLEASARLIPVVNSLRLIKPSEHASIAFNSDNPLNIMDSIRLVAEIGQSTGEIALSVEPSQLYDTSLIEAYAKAARRETAKSHQQAEALR